MADEKSISKNQLISNFSPGNNEKKKTHFAKAPHLCNVFCCSFFFWFHVCNVQVQNILESKKEKPMIYTVLQSEKEKYQSKTMCVFISLNCVHEMKWENEQKNPSKTIDICISRKINRKYNMVWKSKQHNHNNNNNETEY